MTSVLDLASRCLVGYSFDCAPTSLFQVVPQIAWRLDVAVQVQNFAVWPAAED